MALKAGYKGIKKCGPGLKYDNVNGILSLEGESSLKLDNLEDVDITTPLQGDVLMYDGEDWVNEQPDSDPTEDSANLVTSGGVYDALQDRVDWSSYAKTGVHNILPIGYKTTTAGGLTAVAGDDAVITLNGTPTAEHVYLPINVTDLNSYSKTLFKSGMRLIPSTGTSYKFRCRYTDGTYRSAAIENNNVIEFGKDVGVIYVDISDLDTSTPVSDLKIYPMFRYESDTNTAYAPFTMTNRELTDAISNISNGYVKIGRLVLVNKEITLTAALVQGWNENHADFMDLPNPVSYVPFRGHIAGGSFEDFLMNINDANNILATAAHDVGTKIRVSFAYLTNA